MWFRKKIITLGDSGVLIGKTDMHSHLLWGVDDGSKSEQQSQAMVSKTVELGFKKLFCTPHVMAHLPKNDATHLTDEFKEKIVAPSGLEIALAAEYMLDEGFLPKLRGENVLTYDGNLLLIEMSHLSPPRNLYEMIFEITTSGYTPLLAHPERYTQFLTSKDYTTLKDRGCLFQLNLLSLGEIYGNNVNKKAISLLKEGQYDFIGSDMHNEKMISMVSELPITADIEQSLHDMETSTRG